MEQGRQVEAEGQGRGERGAAPCPRGSRGDELDRYRQLADERGLELASIEKLLEIADPSLARSVPRSFQEHHRLLPIARFGRLLVVASCDPDGVIPELADVLDADDLEIRMVTATDYRRLRWAFDLAQVSGAHLRLPGAAGGDETLPHACRVEPEHLALLEAMLLDALAERASTLHLESCPDRVRVRLRVDGRLHDVAHYRLSREQCRGVVRNLKSAANLDPDETRLPQEGGLPARAGRHELDLRVQIQPTLHGESACIRLLPRKTELYSIDDLGMTDELRAEYRRILRSPSGLVLVVGPAGSGRTTTIYAGLELLARDPGRKVLSVEDPIEEGIEGVQQSQIRPELGLGFPQATRACVRADPDVIFVGEIRDRETAREVIRASQSGSLVLSTLHAADSVEAVRRLLDLGAHPAAVAGQLATVLTQRLARRICPDCRVDASPDPRLTREIFPSGPPSGFLSYRGSGCGRCGERGTRGRVGIFELLLPGRSLRGALSRDLPVDVLRAAAREDGLRPLCARALELVERGVIALDELPQLLRPEQLAPEH